MPFLSLLLNSVLILSAIFGIKIAKMFKSQILHKMLELEECQFVFLLRLGTFRL